MMRTIARWLAEPVTDYFAAIDAIRDGGFGAFVLMAAVAAVTWFAYVPVHELMHAWGVLAAGGTVTRLDIAPEYGGAWLAGLFPYVHPGSHYAGQLTGFDTHGNDAIYLAAVLAPYLLTVVFGVPALKFVGRDPHPARTLPRASLLGAAVIVAYAPAISLVGDYYEAGSIVVSRIAHAIEPAIDLKRWRSDDLPKLVRTLDAAGASTIDWIGIGSAFVAGLLLAIATYRLGSLLYRMMSRKPVR